MNNENGEENTHPETLCVQFNNEAGSIATITSIITQPMGKAGKMDIEPVGEWSNNLLKDW